MSAPRVSVLLPCRDAVDALPEAARSLERQAAFLEEEPADFRAVA